MVMVAIGLYHVGSLWSGGVKWNKQFKLSLRQTCILYCPRSFFSDGETWHTNSITCFSRGPKKQKANIRQDKWGRHKLVLMFSDRLGQYCIKILLHILKLMILVKGSIIIIILILLYGGISDWGAHIICSIPVNWLHLCFGSSYLVTPSSVGAS